MSGQTRELLRVSSDVLLRCWSLGFGLLLIGFLASQLALPLITDLHGSLFGLGEHEIRVVLYCGFGLIKLAVLICFFIPWLSLKLVMPKPGN